MAINVGLETVLTEGSIIGIGSNLNFEGAMNDPDIYAYRLEKVPEKMDVIELSDSEDSNATDEFQMSTNRKEPEKPFNHRPIVDESSSVAFDNLDIDNLLEEIANTSNNINFGAPEEELSNEDDGMDEKERSAVEKWAGMLSQGNPEAENRLLLRRKADFIESSLADSIVIEDSETSDTDYDLREFKIVVKKMSPAEVNREISHSGKKRRESSSFRKPGLLPPSKLRKIEQTKAIQRRLSVLVDSDTETDKLSSDSESLANRRAKKSKSNSRSKLAKSVFGSDSDDSSKSDDLKRKIQKKESEKRSVTPSNERPSTMREANKLEKKEKEKQNLGHIPKLMLKRTSKDMDTFTIVNKPKKISMRRKSIAVDTSHHYAPERANRFPVAGPPINIYATKPTLAGMGRIPKISDRQISDSSRAVMDSTSPAIPGPSTLIITDLNQNTPEAIANIIKTCAPQRTDHPKISNRKTQLIEAQPNIKKPQLTKTIKTVTKSVTKTITTKTVRDPEILVDRRKKLQQLAKKEKELKRLGDDADTSNHQRRLSLDWTDREQEERTKANAKVKITKSNRLDKLMGDFKPVALSTFSKIRNRRNSIASANPTVHSEVTPIETEPTPPILNPRICDENLPSTSNYKEISRRISIAPKILFPAPAVKPSTAGTSNGTGALKSCLKPYGSSSKVPKKSVKFGETTTKLVERYLDASPPGSPEPKNNLDQYSSTRTWDQTISEMVSWDTNNLDGPITGFPQIDGCQEMNLLDVKVKYDSLAEYKK